DFSERPGDRMLRLPVIDVADFLPPPCELGARDPEVVTFVHHVVHLAAECVKGGNRAAAIRGQEKKAVIKARAARHGPLLAVLVGTHRIERNSMSGQSRRPSTGRKRKTSPPACSIFSSMRAPPAMIMRISRPIRPFNTRPSGAPEYRSDRARSI